jgi:phosphate transport system permease protein
MHAPRSTSRRDRIGDGLTSLCCAALALNVVLVLGILGVLTAGGIGAFWQRPLVLLEMDDGRRILGEVHDVEPLPHGAAGTTRSRLEVGNRDVTGLDFVWVESPSIRRSSRPPDAALFERLEYGSFYGFLVAVHRAGEPLVEGPAEAWLALPPLLERKHEEARAIERFEHGEIGEVNQRIESLRLAIRRASSGDAANPKRAARLADLGRDETQAQAAYEALALHLAALRDAWLAETLVVETADGERREIPAGHVVRALRPNRMDAGDVLALYAERVVEFVSTDPRESNTEGGIFPAIFGTVMMVFLMSFVVAPLGVLAALYLREYARQGPLLRVVRIAVHNLAGVPSIVFGVFGLGFFVYLVGGSLDRWLAPESLPTPTFGTGGILWASLTLALLTVPVVIVATEEGLAAVPRVVRDGSRALGATKLETTWRVVIPAAAPGILTGLILAMARAAGEVAPLMIVGMVKLAPTLPVDGTPPFVHLERKFMHLGFHIYDLGFQTPNVEATKPLVFATALLLIGVVMLMNLVAIVVRNHLRRKYSGSAV